MSDPATDRCETCGNYVDEEDLFCANCGREKPGGAEAAASAIEVGFVGYDCEGCGASLTYDSEAQGLRCSFCGSVKLKRQPAATGRIRPVSYVPFEVDRERAIGAFRGWVSKGFFRPFGIREGARVETMQAIYVPFWVFRASAHTYWAADSSRTPAFARADWCPVFGERSGEVGDLLVCGSGSLRPAEVAGLRPFDMSRGRPYQREEVREYPVEDFGVSRRGARDRARGLLDDAERAACTALVPGNARNVHVNPLVTQLRSEATLLPLWINAYRFQDKLYRFCVNGQTGKVTGTAPFSWGKLALVVLAALAAAAAIAAIAS